MSTSTFTSSSEIGVRLDRELALAEVRLAGVLELRRRDRSRGGSPRSCPRRDRRRRCRPRGARDQSARRRRRRRARRASSRGATLPPATKTAREAALGPRLRPGGRGRRAGCRAATIGPLGARRRAAFLSRSTSSDVDRRGVTSARSGASNGKLFTSSVARERTLGRRAARRRRRRARGSRACRGRARRRRSCRRGPCASAG